MIFKVSFKEFPKIHRVYAVTRKTVWKARESTHILIFIYNGKCIIETQENKYTVNQGEWILIPKDTKYIRTPIDDQMCTMYYIHFELPISQIEFKEAHEYLFNYDNEFKQLTILCQPFSLLPEHLFLSQISHIADDTEEIREKLDEFSILVNSCLPHEQISLSLAVSKLILNMTEETTNKLMKQNQLLSTTNIPETLRKAIIYIQNNYNKQITLNKLSNHCAVSEQHIIRIFRKYLNTTPMAFLNEFKIDKARELLQNSTSLSIKEICDEIGFKDQCYFSRAFLATTGETPRDFRKRVTKI